MLSIDLCMIQYLQMFVTYKGASWSGNSYVEGTENKFNFMFQVLDVVMK